MKFLKNLLTIIVVLSPVFAFSQGNYQKGLIVNTKGDTVRGYIDLKEWGNNPREINFKSSLDKSSPQVFTVADINYFQIHKITAYKRFTTSISLDETNVQKLHTDRDTSSKIGTVFLKEEQKGKYVALYSYQDDLKERFYIYDNQTGSITELIYRIYYVPNEKNNVTTSSQEAYKQQLLVTAQKSDTYNANIRALIENAEYVRSDLGFICRKINDSKQESGAEKDSKYISFFAGVGVGYNLINFTGVFPLYNMARSHSSVAPKISVGVNFYPVPTVARSVIRLEIAYSTATFQGTGDPYFGDPTIKATYFFKQKTISAIPQFQYNIYNTDPFKLYIDVGLSVNFSKYDGDSYVNPADKDVESNFGLDHQWLSTPIKAGVILNKKLEISLAYSFPTSVSDQISGQHRDFNYAFKLQTVQFGLSYIY